MTETDRLRGLLLAWAPAQTCRHCPQHCPYTPTGTAGAREYERWVRLKGAYLEGRVEVL